MAAIGPNRQKNIVRIGMALDSDPTTATQATQAARKSATSGKQTSAKGGGASSTAPKQKSTPAAKAAGASDSRGTASVDRQTQATPKITASTQKAKAVSGGLTGGGAVPSLGSGTGTAIPQNRLTQVQRIAQELENDYHFLKSFEQDLTGEKLYEEENWADQAKKVLETVQGWISELTGQVNTERQRETSGSFGGGRAGGGAGRDGVYKSPEEHYEALKDEEDFGITTAWMREQTPAAAIPIWQGNVGARNIVRSIQTGDMSGLADEWKHMTDGEKDILLYYAGKGEWDEASKYLDWLETGLNERAAAAQEERVRAFAEEHPVIASALSVPVNLSGGVIGTVDLAGQNIGRLFTGDPVDYYSEGQRIGEMAAQLRVPVRERIEESTDLAIPENVPFVGGRNVAGLLYDTAMDGVDSLSASKLLRSANAAGLLLSNSAAGSMARDVAARGGSDDQALAGGLAAGVFEALFERWSIGDLKAMKELPVTGIKSFARNVAKEPLINETY